MDGVVARIQRIDKGKLLATLGQIVGRSEKAPIAPLKC